MLGIDLKVARAAWSCAAVLLFIVGLFWIRKTLLLFVIALMFTYLLFPIVEAVYRRLSFKSRLAAVIFPFLLILAFVCTFILILRPQIAVEREQLSKQLESGQFKKELSEWRVLDIPAGKIIISNYGHVLNMVPQTSISTMLNATERDLVNIFLVPILSFFLLMDGKKIRDGLIEIWCSAYRSPEACISWRRTIENVLSDAHVLILEYMRALLFLCLATLIAYSIGLKLLGVPYAILLALIAFPLEFIPLVGPLVSAIIILAVCELNKFMYVDRFAHLHIPWVIVFLIVYRIFQDYVLSPHLMKKGVKLHPLLVIFGVFAGGEIGHIGGIFLSVPILALLRLVYYEWRKRNVGEVSTAALVEPANGLPMESASI